MDTDLSSQTPTFAEPDLLVEGLSARIRRSHLNHDLAEVAVAREMEASLEQGSTHASAPRVWSQECAQLSYMCHRMKDRRIQVQRLVADHSCLPGLSGVEGF